VPEVVRQVIALGFQGVGVLILHLPSSAPGLHNSCHIAGMDDVVADKRVASHS